MLNFKLTELEKLTILRKKKGISQQEMAKVLNCNQSYVSYLERNQRRFHADRYNKYKQFILNYDKDKHQEYVDNTG